MVVDDPRTQRKDPMHPTKAVSYIRVSGQGQVSGDGPERQRRAINKYARANGLAVTEEFADLGVSGATELADRPGLATLLDRVESNGVRIVLIERADRLARDLMVQEVTLDAFSRAGVRVVTSEGNTLTGDAAMDPTRKLIRQVLGAVSEFDKNIVVLKLRAARERKRRLTGRCEGRKPYGHHPAEQAVIAKMKALRRKPRGGPRLSFAKIADRLNSDGATNRAGGRWTPQRVFQVLG